MIITNTETEDIDAIFKLYDEATTYQQVVAETSWNGFERSKVAIEILEKRHFKILEGEVIACTFVITFSDPAIWKEAGYDPAIYIHRIATNPLFRGYGYVKHIVKWAMNYAGKNDKYFIRMDTKSGNERLNSYYRGCGFTYLGVTTIEWTDDLPIHYKNGSLSLFEIKLDHP